MADLLSIGDNRRMRGLRVGDLVFYDSRSAEERANIRSTAPYSKIGCEVVAVGEGVATLQQLGGVRVFADVPFAQIELQ